MTCFSIQKSSLFAAAFGVFVNLVPLAAVAEQVQPPREEIEKLEKEEQRERDAAIGKVDSPIVIELFTTADCTACVFADRVLYDTMKDKNVIALSCKIADLSEMRTKFESAPKPGEETKPAEESKKQKGPMDPCVFRQWTYRSSFTSSEVRITIPSFVFNGYDLVGAEDMNYFMQMVNAYHYEGKNKTLEVFMRWKDKDTITVHLPEDPKAGNTKRSASVWIIRYKDMMVEKVEEGLNKGRVLRFSNVIQNIKHIGKWHQQMRSIDIDVAAPQGGKERGGYVVLVQEMMGEPVLAAGKLVDYPHPNDLKLKAEAEAKARALEEKRAKERATPTKPSPERSVPEQKPAAPPQ